MRVNLNPYLLGYDDLPFDTLYQAAIHGNFGALEFPSWDIKTIAQAKEAGMKMQDAGLVWGLVPMPFDFLQGSDEAFDAGVDALAKLLPVAQAAGVKLAYNHIWSGSNERAYEENLEWHVRRIGKVQRMNADHGIHYGLEILGPRPVCNAFRYPFINDYREGIPFIQAISPDLGFVVDTYHWFTSNGTLEDILAIGDGTKIVNLHVNDAWPGRKSLDEHGDFERELPLETGVIDAISVVKAVAELGYDGIVTCEPFEPACSRLHKLPMDEALMVVSNSVHRLLRLSAVER